MIAKREYGDYGEIFNGCMIDHNALLASLGMTGRDYICKIKSKVAVKING